MMFDFQEYYDRIADEMPQDCKVVEIGVSNGDSALYLAKKLFESGKMFTLYMVDNMDYGGYEQLVTIYENIIESGLGEFIKVIPEDSIEASKRFNGHSLNFVMLDSSHLYKETKQSLIAWYPKLLDGGILAGHDYLTAPPVKKAVDEVVPKEIKRETIDTPEHYQEFETEQVLFIENTAEGYGLFYFKNRFYLSLNQ